MLRTLPILMKECLSPITRTGKVLIVLSCLPAIMVSQDRDLAKDFDLFRLVQRDTLHVKAGNIIRFADPTSNWAGKPECSIRVFSKGTENKNSVQYFNVEPSIGGDVQYRVSARLKFDSAGVYTVLRIMEGRGFDNRTYRYGDVWHVNVEWPKLHPLVDAQYFYGEFSSFDFSTSHDHHDLYSYEVLAGSRSLFKENGSIVRIENIWEKHPEVLDDFITVRGYYEGKLFTYEDPVLNSRVNSTWKFVIQRPVATWEISLWQDSSMFDRFKSSNNTDSLRTLDINLNAEYSPLEFRFTRYTPIRNGFLMFVPTPREELVAVTPPGFARFHWEERDPWQVLVLTPNPEFFGTKPTTDPIEVTVSIRFRDQFNYQINRTYKAKIFSSK